MENSSLNNRVQKFGRFLSGMVMPNIAAFIAWGLITALFIPTGWLPNECLASLVSPIIVYLLPLLIGFTGGKIVYGIRGGVLGAIGAMGVIIGTNIPMFIGVMIMGPFSGFVIKKVDKFLEDKVPTGFEMLVNNFSAGIIGSALAIMAYLGIGPVVEVLSATLGSMVESVVSAGLLPIASIIIEPAKVLFLNNAINHGVLSPLGIEQAAETGKSILFFVETNPGPGLGILLAYYVFTKGTVKQSTLGAMIIHFLGGIHEIYFPYILMQPKLILATIAGGASGVLIVTLLGGGLVATPSPGSIIVIMALAAKGGFFSVLLGVIVSTVVTFLVAALLIKRNTEDESLESAKKKMKEMKVKKEEAQPEHLQVMDTEKLLDQSDLSSIGFEGKNNVSTTKLETLTRDNIKLNLPSMDKVEAIKMAGQILYEAGYVEEVYIEAMVQRDKELSTYIGNGTAIPHGVSEAKKKIKQTGISILQFPEGVDFDGNTVYLVVGIAGMGNEHLMILSNLAEIVEDEEKVEQLRMTNDVNYIYKMFNK